jgi:hypothetical protein
MVSSAAIHGAAWLFYVRALNALKIIRCKLFNAMRRATASFNTVSDSEQEVPGRLTVLQVPFTKV